MVKIKRKGFGFTLEVVGEVKVNESKIKPYKDYVKEEENKQIEEQIFQYLCSICPSATPPKTFWDMNYYYVQAGLKELANHLANNMEV